MEFMSNRQVEAAARELCRLRKIDADVMVAHGADPDSLNGMAPSVCLYSPAWRLAKKEVEEAEIMQSALEAGRKA